MPEVKRKRNGSKTYHCWNHMKDRCLNPGNSRWDAYGGRGITVCERWLTFENFLADMGEKPEGLSLDRIDNHGNYTPENCRWATPSEQMNNRRGNRFIEYEGRRQTVAEWAREKGLRYGLLQTRLNNGWSVSDAFNRPAKTPDSPPVDTVTIHLRITPNNRRRYQRLANGGGYESMSDWMRHALEEVAEKEEFDAQPKEEAA